MKIFIAGDSTAAKKQAYERPETGWGECLSEFISPIYDIINYAENGRSTKSFIDKGLLDRIDQEITRGDLLIIQFGHNDEKKEDPERYTSLESYELNLKKFAQVTKKHEAIPIFISSITRRTFVDGTLNKNAIKDYPHAMKAFAVSHGYPFIDMYKLSQNIISHLGEEDSKRYYLHLKPNESTNYPKGLIDNTHFNPYGARQFAALIASQLQKLI